MAYFSQEMKKERVALLKPIMKKYGITKVTYSVLDCSVFVVCLREGSFDFLPDGINYSEVNKYHFERHFEDKPREIAFFREVFRIMEDGNYNSADDYADYCNYRFYTSLKIGSYDKPYICTAQV